jgi:hypothetical protein
MCIDHHSMDEKLRKVERPTDSKGSGGSAILPGGNENAPSHARSVTNSTERLDKRFGGTAIIGEINVYR